MRLFSRRNRTTPRNAPVGYAGGNGGGMGTATRPRPSFPAMDERDLETEIDGPGRNKGVVPEEREPERDVVALIQKRFTEASNHRDHLSREWIYCLAMVEGNQWCRWNERGQFVSSRAVDDPFRAYDESNFLAPNLKKYLARITQNKPDAGVRPFTRGEQDENAADEGRAIIADCDREFDRQQQTLCLSHWSAVMAAPGLKIYWDHDKEVSVVTQVDPGTGEVTQTRKAKAGGLCEEEVSPLYLYVDPASTDCYWRDARYILHAQPRSLSFIEEQWGKEAVSKVRGGAGLSEGYISLLNAYISAMTGRFGSDSLLSPETVKGMALVVECWEKPTPRYPEGRYIVIAGDREMVYDDWPYEKKDVFPIIPLVCHRVLGSPYSEGIIRGAAPMQAQYNHISSRITDRINSDFPTVLVPKGAEIGVDAYSSPRNYKLIYHTDGRVPVYQQAPAVNQYWFAKLEMLRDNIRDYMGVHEISDGQVPGGVSAARAIELLQQSDVTQMAEAAAHMEYLHVQRAEWEIALHSQFAREPRLMAIADEPGREGQAQVVAFAALRGGGQVRVVVTPGSAIPKSPIAREEQIDIWLDKGLLGVPGSPEAAKAYFDLRGESRSDELVSSVRASLAAQTEREQAMMDQQAQNEQAMQQQALAAQAAQAQQQSQMNAQLAREQAQIDSQTELAKEQARLSAQPDPIVVNDAKAQADTESKAFLANQQAELDVETYGEKAVIDVEKQRQVQKFMPKPQLPAGQSRPRPRMGTAR